MTQSVLGRCSAKCATGDANEIEFRTLAGDGEQGSLVVTARPGIGEMVVHVQLDPEKAKALHRELGDILTQIV